MQSIIGALTWEYFARNRWLLLFPILANIPACMVLLPLRGLGPLNPSRELIGIHIVLLLALVLIVGFGVLVTQTRDLSSLYLMPVSTIRLASFYYWSGALLVGLQVGFMIWAWRSIIGIDWPMAGPLLFSVACWCAFQPLVRGVLHSLWWITAAIAILAALTLWLLHTHGIPLQSGGMISPATHLWSSISSVDMLIASAIVCISFPLTVWRMALDRSGQRQMSFLEKLDLTWEHRQSVWNMKSLEFHSPAQAIGWFDYHTRMMIIPTVVIVGLLFTWFLAVFVGLLKGDLNLLVVTALGGTNLMALSQILLALQVALLQYFGLFLNQNASLDNLPMARKSTSFESGPFLDMLPVSPQDKAAAKLRSTAIACAISTMALVVSFLLVATSASLLGTDLKSMLEIKVSFSKYFTFVCGGVLLASFAFSSLPVAIPAMMSRVNLIDLWIYPIVVMSILIAFGTPVATCLAAGLGVLVLMALVHATIQSLIDKDVSNRFAICIWIAGLSFVLGAFALVQSELRATGAMLLTSLVGLAMLPFFTTTDSLRRARTI